MSGRETVTTLGGVGDDADAVTRTTAGRSFDIARVAARAADAKKATDVVALDLMALSDVCDVIVVCTGANSRLVDAVVDEVLDRVAAELGADPLSIEGRSEGKWVLVDYGGCVVHVFSPDERAFYRLERLWGDAPRLDPGLEG